MPVTLGLAGVGVAAGAVQSIIGASQAAKAKKSLLNQIDKQSVYQPSEYASKMMAEAQARENAKSAAVTYGQSMAASGLANAQGLAQRNASSGQQALAMGASNVGQYNQAIMDLGQLQNQYNQQNIQNTAAARGVMIGEGDKAFASRRQKEDQYANLYAGQLAAGNAMLGQGLSSIAQSGISAVSASKDANRGGGSSGSSLPSYLSTYRPKQMNLNTSMPDIYDYYRQNR